MSKDYYNILGIGKNASPDEIKKAYRKLAHQYHPDKQGGDEQKFKEINEAYQVLGNPEKRQQYDQYGQTFEQAKRQGGFSGFEGFRDFSDFASAFRGNGSAQDFDFGGFGDIFGDLFGFQRGTGGRKRGGDLQTSINITFKEAVFGAEKIINITKDNVCTRCSGTGAEPGSKVVTCPTCHGRGNVVRSVAFGIQMSSVCPTCGGAGKKAEKNCSKCRGRGVVRETSELKIKVPAGIDDGQSIKLSGQGQAGSSGGRAGDLYVVVNVAKDAEFEREGFDILSRREISVSQAALGDKILVDTLDGRIKLKIPAGTQSGKVFVLRGLGIPHLHGRGRGNHLVEINVKTPTNLSRRQKELLEELRKEDGR
ncbi:molecular chaperone DnaJ [Candidatus Parcubacteria bacterium]|nr:MAG: molecular chaperone DnaJ [Candidatus Parcubacteria bacterium]